MKKDTLRLPIILMFLVIGILLVLMALPFGQTQVDAVGGITDLRGWDLSRAIYRLGGEWQIMPRQLVLPEDFPDDALTRVIPEKWARTFDELNTFATYRLTIQTDDTRQLILTVPEIYMAYRMWINGEFVRGAGVVADNHTDSVPEFESVIVPVWAKDGKIEIVLQISNYHYMRPMMGSVIMLGERDSAYTWFFRTRSLYIITLGICVYGAFYHIALYVLRRKDKIYLLFSILCFISFWQFAIDTNGLSNLTGWFSAGIGGLLDMKTFMVLFFLHGTAIAAYGLYVFDRDWITKRYKWALGYAFFGMILFAAIPWNFPWAPHMVILIMGPPILLSIYKAARSRVLRENRLMWLFFGALVFHAVITVVQKFFLDHLLFMTGLISDAFLLMAQALILARQFAELHEAEQSLEGKNEVLDRLNSMKTEFFHNMSHDFKTPLTVISVSVLNATEMLDFEIDKDEMRESLENAQSEVMHMARMVESAMKQASMYDNRQDMSPIDIAQILREGAETHRAIIERRGNTLTLDISDLPMIYGNADMILHVLSNLLTNANRYTRDGRIAIISRCEYCSSQPQVFISVCDNGEGVKPEMLPHIFERGVSDGGTGLGLAICKTAVEAHGGTIEAESEYGVGTILRFTIPIIERRHKPREREGGAI